MHPNPQRFSLLHVCTHFNSNIRFLSEFRKLFLNSSATNSTMVFNIILSLHWPPRKKQYFSGKFFQNTLIFFRCYSSVIWNAEFDIPRDLRPNSKVRPQPGFDWTSDAWNLTPVSLSAGQQNCATVTVPNFHDSTGNRFKHCSERPHIVLGIGQQQK